MTERKFHKYKIATTAIHQLGDISSDEPDLCHVYNEDEENWIGAWVLGMGFFDVKFPKATTRDLTEEEMKYWKSQNVQISDHPSYKAIGADYKQ